MKFLLTGSAGFIGSHLNKKLIELNFETLLFDRMMDKIYKGNNFEEIELCDIDFNDVDAVFHCAASHPSQIISDNELIEGNMSLTKRLLKKFILSKPKAIIFLSSISLYGSARPQIIHLDSPIINPSLYGQQKASCEQVIASWGLENNVFTHLIRLPAVLGSGAHQTFLPRLVESIKTFKPFQTHKFSSMFNHIVHVDDLCNFLINISKTNSSSLSQVGSPDPISIQMIIQQISEYFKISDNLIISGEEVSGPIDIAVALSMGFKSSNTSDLINQMLINNDKIMQ